MKQYIVTEVVKAWPAYQCNRKGYLPKYVSVDGVIPPGSEPEEGYQAECSDGIVRWFPKDRFEAMYREAKDMSFGMAIEAMKKGKRVARAGWNGKGMYVFLADGVEFSTMADMSEFGEDEVYVSDTLVLRTAQKTLQPGWLASQSDMLADDWYIVE